MFLPNLLRNFNENSNFDLFLSSISFKPFFLQCEIYLSLKDWPQNKIIIDYFINLFN
jgi:hypothetical protein